MSGSTHLPSDPWAPVKSCASGPALPHLRKCIFWHLFCLFSPWKSRVNVSHLKEEGIYKKKLLGIFPLQTLVLNRALLLKKRNKCTIPPALAKATVLTTGGQGWPLIPIHIYQHSKLLSKEAYNWTIKASISLDDISSYVPLTAKILIGLTKLISLGQIQVWGSAQKVFSRLFVCNFSSVRHCSAVLHATDGCLPKKCDKSSWEYKKQKSYVSFSAQKLSK